MSADSHATSRTNEELSGEELYQNFAQVCCGQDMYSITVSEKIGKTIISMGSCFVTAGFYPTEVWIAKYVTRLNQFKVSDEIKAAAIKYLAEALMVRDQCIRQFPAPEGDLFDQHANWPQMLRIVCQVASPSLAVPTSAPAPVFSP